MSNEFSSASKGFSDFNEEHQKKLAILAVASRASKKLTSIFEMQQMALKYPEEINSLDVLKARERHLEMLVESTLDFAEYGDDASYIGIDEIEEQVPFLDIPEDNTFSRRKYMKISEEATVMATNDFLELLVPDSVSDESDREIYFSKWSRSLVERRYGQDLVEDEDGSARVCFATRLPNIVMAYHYPSGEQVPERRLYLASVFESQSFIPPSLQQ